jgi:hypothetical protein
MLRAIRRGWRDAPVKLHLGDGAAEVEGRDRLTSIGREWCRLSKEIRCG